MAVSEQDRHSIILRNARANVHDFIEFMHRSESPYNKFLRDVLQLHGKVEEPVFGRLFIAVCSLHKGQDLQVSLQMIEKAMVVLTERSHNTNAALGLLNLAYINSISFTGLPVQTLSDFQTQYEAQVASFVRMIPRVKRLVIELMPATVFCLSPPLLKWLKEGGDILHQQVPVDFLGAVL